MKLRYLGFIAVAIIIAAVLFKIFGSHGAGGPGMGMGAGGVMPANVAKAIEKEVEVWNEFPGRLQATDTVDIRPRVGGTIDKILFTEGSIVKQGDPLFVIDPRPYTAEVARAEANLASAKSQVEYTENEFKRAQALVATDVIAKSRYDEKESAKLAAVAAEKAAEAALEVAKLNLEYANIRAPITGRISRAEITVGNLVDPASPQILASIVSITPIYAEFNIDEQTYLKYAGVSDPHADVSKVPVQITLAGDNAPTVSGFMKSYDNQLDAKSGTIRARAVFDNKDGKLLPGLFAKISLGSATKRDAVLITDRAIGTDQDKKFVFVVNSENKIEYRPIVLGSTAEGLRIVESGLKGGDKVVVNGIFRLRPGAQVTPQEVPMEGTENMAQEVKEGGAAKSGDSLDNVEKPADDKQAEADKK